jgi:CubicO group peptidase (beta-lactamase class C family)
VRATTPPVAIHATGHCDPAFRPVVDAFEAHFQRTDEFRELGAGVAVYVCGECVVDVHAGFQDEARRVPWTTTTLVNVWSASKGVMALAVAQLVDAGRLDYDAPVARYWPEFAQNGKAGITLGQVVSHQSGLNGFAEPTTPEELLDWDLITARLARQAPLWSPGSLTSYHGMTYGWLTGELVQRASGLQLREYLRRHIAVPLGADLWLGAPDEREGDVAEIVAPEPDRTPVPLNDIARHAVVNPVPDAAAANRVEWRRACIPSVNVHATADGLARVYAALANGGSLHGVRIITPRGIGALRAVRSRGPDQMLGERHWGAGVALNTVYTYGPDRSTFGHSGWGGSFGCANVERGIAIAYVVNRMGSQLNGDPRARSIATAAFQCLGR